MSYAKPVVGLSQCCCRCTWGDHKWCLWSRWSSQELLSQLEVVGQECRSLPCPLSLGLHIWHICFLQLLPEYYPKICKADLPDLFCHFVLPESFHEMLGFHCLVTWSIGRWCAFCCLCPKCRCTAFSLFLHNIFIREVINADVQRLSINTQRLTPNHF